MALLNIVYTYKMDFLGKMVWFANDQSNFMNGGCGDTKEEAKARLLKSMQVAEFNEKNTHTEVETILVAPVPVPTEE